MTTAVDHWDAAAKFVTIAALGQSPTAPSYTTPWDMPYRWLDGPQTSGLSHYWGEYRASLRRCGGVLIEVYQLHFVTDFRCRRGSVWRREAEIALEAVQRRSTLYRAADKWNMDTDVRRWCKIKPRHGLFHRWPEW